MKFIQKKIGAVWLCLLALLLSPTAAALAPGELVETGGQVVGISFPCQGVIVSSLADIETPNGTVCPAKEAGLEPGDRILTLAGRPIGSSEDFLMAVGELTGEAVTVEICRGQQHLAMYLKPVKSTRGVWQLGLWLRDNIRGIGTVTFRDPETGVFGALGHGVELSESAGLLPVETGTVSAAEVTEVVRGQRGRPGELCAREISGDTGVLYANTAAGIFGRCDTAFAGGKTAVLAPAAAVTPGEVTILSTVDDAGVRSFSARILRVDREAPDERELALQITDPALLDATGGLVQGMSGSPIMQNGALVGAVTPVLVSDPTKGYGITAENMLTAAQEGN